MSRFFCFGKAKEEELQYKQIFGCDAGQLPFKYLGISIHYKKNSGIRIGIRWRPILKVN
jgi:hypothetical protein